MVVTKEQSPTPATEAYDRGNKFKMYRLNPCLQEYVLVDSEAVAVEIFRRAQQDTWQILNYQTGDWVELTSVDFAFPIEAIYEDIVFDSTGMVSNQPNPSV